MQQAHLPMYIRTCSWNVSYPFQLQYVPVYHHHSDVLFLHSTIREIFRFYMHDLLLSYYWLRHGNHLFRNIFHKATAPIIVGIRLKFKQKWQKSMHMCKDNCFYAYFFHYYPVIIPSSFSQSSNADAMTASIS